MKDSVVFAPIPGPDGGIVALTLWPPGTWLAKNAWQVLVGECGVGRASSRAEAETLLLSAAQEECDRRILRAEAEAKHYRTVRPQRLVLLTEEGQ